MVFDMNTLGKNLRSQQNVVVKETSQNEENAAVCEQNDFNLRLI